MKLLINQIPPLTLTHPEGLEPILIVEHVRQNAIVNVNLTVETEPHGWDIIFLYPGRSELQANGRLVYFFANFV